MSEHEPFEELLARRTELSPAEEEILEAHLQDCQVCRRTAEAYARQADLLRSLPLVVPPATLRAGVVAAVRQPSPHRWAFRPVFALAPLAAALLVVAALAALRHPGRTHPVALPASPTAPKLTVIHHPAPKAHAAPKRQAPKRHAPKHSARKTYRPVTAPPVSSGRPAASTPSQPGPAPVVAANYSTPAAGGSQPTATVSTGAVSIAIGAQSPLPRPRQPSPAAPQPPRQSPRPTAAAPSPPKTGGSGGTPATPRPVSAVRPTATAPPPPTAGPTAPVGVTASGGPTATPGTVPLAPVRATPSPTPTP